MVFFDFNLFYMFDVLLIEGSVVCVGRWLWLSFFVMSWVFVWFCVIIGD